MTQDLLNRIGRVTDAVSAVRVPAMPEEYDIHALVGRSLSAAGIDYRHEFRLGPRRRIDFMAGGIGIEIKKGRPSARLVREQLARYLECEALEAVVVVAQKSLPLPGSIGGKPVRMVSLDRLWGVALP